MSRHLLLLKIPQLWETYRYYTFKFFFLFFVSMVRLYSKLNLNYIFKTESIGIHSLLTCC